MRALSGVELKSPVTIKVMLSRAESGSTGPWREIGLADALASSEVKSRMEMALGAFVLLARETGESEGELEGEGVRPREREEEADANTPPSASDAEDNDDEEDDEGVAPVLSATESCCPLRNDFSSVSITGRRISKSRFLVS